MNRFVLLRALSILIAPGAGLAAPITVNFSGVFESISDVTNELDPLIQAGVAVTGLYTIDPANASVMSNVPPATNWTIAPSGVLEVSYATRTLTMDIVLVRIRNEGARGVDSWLLQAFGPTGPGPSAGWLFFEGTEQFATPLFFVNQDLLSWSEGGTLRLFQGIGTADASIVPEPSPIVLLALGLIGLATQSRQGRVRCASRRTSQLNDSRRRASHS